MKKINTVSLVGLGAIGAVYGSKLHTLLGESFRVVADSNRIKKLQANRIRVNGQEQDLNFITPETTIEPADLVIFAVKNEHLPQAIEDVKCHVGPDTIILSLLNGISSEEEIAAVYNENDHILYSMCVEIDALREGNNIQFSTIGRICFGERDKSISDDVLAVQELFDEAEIPYEISEDIWQAIWWKFMLNVGANQTSAILRAPYGILQEVSSAYEMVESAMYEVLAVSEKAGVNLKEEDLKKVKPIIGNLSPSGKTSMLQDIEAGRKTEVEYLGGKVCELGLKYGVPTPVNEQLSKIIHIMEDIAKQDQMVKA